MRDHVGTLESVEESVDWLRDASRSPILLFMDIHLADGDSFRIFERGGGHGAGDLHDSLRPLCAGGLQGRTASTTCSSRSMRQRRCSGRWTSCMRLSKGRSAADYGSRVSHGWPSVPARGEQTFLVHVRDKIIPLQTRAISPICYTCNEKVTAYTLRRGVLSARQDARNVAGVAAGEADFFRANRQFIVARPRRRRRLPCGSAAVFR